MSNFAVTYSDEAETFILHKCIKKTVWTINILLFIFKWTKPKKIKMTFLSLYRAKLIKIYWTILIFYGMINAKLWVDSIYTLIIINNSKYFLKFIKEYGPFNQLSSAHVPHRDWSGKYSACCGLY